VPVDHEYIEGAAPEEERAFFRARFAGGRFDSHSIPFEVLADLSTYRHLIIDVAKMLFKKRHDNRVRVPKGFGDSFQIGLTEVRGGQSAVAIAHRIPSTLPVTEQYALPFPTHQEFEEARAYVEELIRHVGSTGYVPRDFPTELAGRFNPFGQSLQDDEYVELSHGTSSPVRYDTFIRKKIVLSREKTYENSVDAIFTLNGGVLDTGTIHVRDGSGSSLDFRPLTESEFEKAMARAPCHVRLVGSGLYDGDEKLRRLVEVSAVYDDDQARQAFEDRLDEISATPAGWFENDNPAPSGNAVATMRQLMSEITANIDPLPSYLYPTPDGGVTVEWSVDGWEASATVPIGGHSIEFHAVNSVSMTEISFVAEAVQSEMTATFREFWAGLTSDHEGQL
jgi:hypothetical protein